MENPSFTEDQWQILIHDSSDAMEGVQGISDDIPALELALEAVTEEESELLVAVMSHKKTVTQYAIDTIPENAITGTRAGKIHSIRAAIRSLRQQYDVVIDTIYR